MDGILIVDKPDGMTSHDVVARVRRILGTRRVGHTGTLDPFATGVLVLLVGKATRLAQFIDKDEKEYEATIRFGFGTDTGDREGLRIADCGLRIEELIARLAGTDWDAVFSKFRGELMQMPPMYSAKKVEGKRLYELARGGVEVERKPVAIFISELERLDRSQYPELRIRTVCSAGTYVRTLAEDIGRAIGVGAHLTELRRTRAGKFTIDEAITLDELQKVADPDALLRPLSDAVQHLPQIVLTTERAKKTKDGLATRTDEQFTQGDYVRMLDESGQVLAIGVYNSDEKTVKPKIVLL
jgi:tRNA pseudouridine55 synthase